MVKAACKAEAASVKKMKPDKTLNKLKSPNVTQPMIDQYQQLQPGDLFKVNTDKGQSDRQTGETQEQWATRMKKESADIYKRMAAF